MAVQFPWESGTSMAAPTAPTAVAPASAQFPWQAGYSASAAPAASAPSVAQFPWEQAQSSAPKAAPAQQLSAATAPTKPAASIPFWQNALGAINQFGKEFSAATPQMSPSMRMPEGRGGKLTTAQQFQQNDQAPGGVAKPTQAYLNTPGAKTVKGSWGAGLAADTLGQTATWAPAGALTGGAADLLGVGAKALSTAPTVARLIGYAGRGAVTGLAATAAQGRNPFSKYGLENAAWGAGGDVGGEVAGGLAGAGIKKLSAAFSRSESSYDSIIQQAADKYGVDPGLIKAVIKEESGFNPRARSKTGAMGMMQLEPATAKGLGVSNAWDAAQNIDGGTKYLKQLIKKYGGNEAKALEAYNAGPGNVDSGNVPKSTKAYAQQVLKNWNEYGHTPAKGLPMLGAGKAGYPMLQAGDTVAGALPGQTTYPREGGFDAATPTIKAVPRSYSPSMKAFEDAHAKAVSDLQDGLETTHNYIQHWDPLAPYFGDDDVKMLSKADKDELSRAAYDDLKDKTGVDVNHLEDEEKRTAAELKEQKATTLKDKLAAGAERRKLAHSAGTSKAYDEQYGNNDVDLAVAGDHANMRPLKQPDWIKRSDQKSAPRTSGDLNVARTVLKGYKKYRANNVQKVWDGFPELQSEFPEVGNYLDKKAAKASQDGAGAPKKTAKVQTPKSPAHPVETPEDNGENPSPAITKVSQKTRAWAATQESSAKAILAKLAAQHAAGTERLGAGLDPDYLKAYTQLGVAKIAYGAADFADWSAAMIEDYGKAVKPYLKQAFQAAKTAIAEQDAIDQDYEHTVPDTSDSIKSKDAGRFNLGAMLHKGYTLGVDRLVGLGQMTKNLDKNIKAIDGKGLSDKDNAALLGYNMSYASGTSEYIRDHALVDTDGKEIGESYKSLCSRILKKVPMKKVEEYMKARHAPSWLSKGRKVYPERYGITPDEAGVAKANAIVARLEKQFPDLKQWADEHDAWHQKMGEAWLKGTGYFSDKTWKGWRVQFPHYIPLRRIMGPAEHSVASMGKRGTGSERPTMSFLESELESIGQIVDKVRANGVRQAVLRDIDDHPKAMSIFARRDDVDESGLAAQSLENDKDPFKAEDELQQPVDEDDSKILQKHGNTVIVRDNGKAIALKIEDPNLLYAMRHLKPGAQTGIIEAVRGVTNGFKALTTSSNPIFTFTKHIFYDNLTALTTSKTLNNPIDYIKYPFQLLKAATDIVKNGEDWRTFQAMGGSSMHLGANLGRTNLGSHIDDMMPIDWSLSGANKAIRKGEGFLQSVDRVGLTSARLAEFSRQLKKGATTQRAFYEASDLTYNAKKSGEFTRGADAVIPFLNAGIQGVDKAVRTFIDNPAGATGKAFMTLTLPAAILFAINRNNPNYKKLSQYIKDHYYCIPIEGGKEFVKIVKPRALGVLFATAPERIMDRVFNKNSQAFKGFSEGFEQYFTPLEDMSSWIGQPVEDVWANKSYSGAPIVSSKLSTLSPKYQYDDKDTWLAKQIGSVMNWSPKKIDYLLSSYGGVANQLGSPLQSLKSSTIADPEQSNDTETNFYDIKGQLSQAVADYKAKGVRSKYYKPALNKAFTRASTRMSDITKQEKRVQDSKLPDAQKQRMLTILKQRQQNIMSQIVKQAGGQI